MMAALVEMERDLTPEEQWRVQPLRVREAEWAGLPCPFPKATDASTPSDAAPGSGFG